VSLQLMNEFIRHEALQAIKHEGGAEAVSFRKRIEPDQSHGHELPCRHPVTKPLPIGVRQHEAAERKEEIDCEIAFEERSERDRLAGI
jgi:hypothetical protein